MNKRDVILTFIVFFFSCISAFPELGGIGSVDLYENSVKLMQQVNRDNGTDDSTSNTIESNLVNIPENDTVDTIENTTENINADTYQWLERVEVSDYKPDAGDTITIEGFGWDPNKYSDGIRISLNGGGLTDLIVGYVVPDSNGYFKIRVRLPDSYRYNDVIEIRMGEQSEARAALLIQD